MKQLFAIMFMSLPMLGIGQVKNISIDYDLFKTVYKANNIDIGKQNFKKILQENEKAYRVFKQGRLVLTTGNIVATPSFLLLLVTIQNNNKGNTPYDWQWVGGISGSIIGTALYYIGESRTLKSVGIFNSKNKLTFEFNSKNSVGLVLKF